MKTPDSIPPAAGRLPIAPATDLRHAPASGFRRSLTANRRAFSLIEILIVMGLLSVIVLGLMAMFNQTQRAFRLGMTQTDVLEAGRMATDILLREVEQTTPCYANPYAPVFASPVFSVTLPVPVVPDPPNLNILPLGGGNFPRTNVMDDLFFLTRENQTWTGIGYFVRTNLALPGADRLGTGPVGILYRFETNQTIAQFRQNPGGMYAGFNAALNGTYGVNGVRVSKIIEGVVGFRVRAYDLDGFVIGYVNTNNIVALPSIPVPEEMDCAFGSNAAPAYVEIELSILEPQILERFRSLPVFAAQTNYLASQSSHVHVFRQRIAVRGVDPLAYR